MQEEIIGSSRVHGHIETAGEPARSPGVPTKVSSQMRQGRRSIRLLALLTLLGVAATGGTCPKPYVAPHITITKNMNQTGGWLEIQGADFKGYQGNGNESVSLEIKNVALRNDWVLGNATAVNGSFSFTTVPVNCNKVQDYPTCNNYKDQQFTVVARGSTSGEIASNVSTASGVFICPCQPN